MEVPHDALRHGHGHGHREVPLLSLEERHITFHVEDVRTWRPPVFELWLEQAAEKQLLGLARFNSSGELCASVGMYVHSER